MTWLTGETRTATVTALADSVLLEVGFEAMRTLLHKRSELAEVLARRLDKYRQRNEERVRELSASNTKIGVRQSGPLAQIRNAFSLG